MAAMRRAIAAGRLTEFAAERAESRDHAAE
jgi:queuine/archaeosine tRNA-ribosyltransferase